MPFAFQNTYNRVQQPRPQGVWWGAPAQTRRMPPVHPARAGGVAWGTGKQWGGFEPILGGATGTTKRLLGDLTHGVTAGVAEELTEEYIEAHTPASPVASSNQTTDQLALGPGNGTRALEAQSFRGLPAGKQAIEAAHREVPYGKPVVGRGPFPVGPAGTTVAPGSVVFEASGGPTRTQSKFAGTPIADRFGPVKESVINMVPASGRTRATTRFQRLRSLNDNPVAQRQALREG